jgi:hypothetical protein
MIRLTLIAFALLASPALAQGGAQSQPPPAAGAVGPATALTPAPDDRAKQWLGLVDDQNFSDAYKQLGPGAQKKIEAGPWADKIRATREPLGAMSSRALQDIKMSKTLPGMPDGQYATVQFDTAFAHRAQALETVVLTSDKGAWSVVSYSIK